MPLIPSSYKAPRWVPGKHSETVLPSLFREVEGVCYTRERILTPDGDFLDLDWSCGGCRRVAILSHGLEGSTFSSYVLGMVKVLNAAGWDTVAWNLRGCSGELNLQRQFYHAGSTEDLDAVVRHVVSTRQYSEIVLIGFSIGGNIVLKYLGENGSEIASYISKSVVFSVPCDLHSCVKKLSQGVNCMYLHNFLSTLKSKLIEKAIRYPDLLLNKDMSNIHSFTDFDNQFTAPLSGFRDALHYYAECSTTKLISDIRVPTLIVNAQNDPILDFSCSPIQECKNSQWVNLELPSNGGHLGFMKNKINGEYWSEERATQFLRSS